MKQGLVQAMQNLLPTSFHMMCCHHILQKFQNRFKQTRLKDLFWEAARAPNASEFEVAMCMLRDENLPV